MNEKRIKEIVEEYINDEATNYIKGDAFEEVRDIIIDEVAQSSRAIALGEVESILQRKETMKRLYVAASSPFDYLLNQLISRVFRVIVLIILLIPLVSGIFLIFALLYQVLQ